MYVYIGMHTSIHVCACVCEHLLLCLGDKGHLIEERV